MFKTLSLAVFIPLVVVTFCAPSEKPSKYKLSSENCTDDTGEFSEIVDERQNGTENYRINVNGVILMWAPAASLLTAAGLLDEANMDTEFEEVQFLHSGQESTTESNDVKPQTTKRPKLRIPAFILPFLKNKRSKH